MTNNIYELEKKLSRELTELEAQRRAKLAKVMEERNKLAFRTRWEAKFDDVRLVKPVESLLFIVHTDWTISVLRYQVWDDNCDPEFGLVGHKPGYEALAEAGLIPAELVAEFSALETEVKKKRDYTGTVRQFIALAESLGIPLPEPEETYPNAIDIMPITFEDALKLLQSTGDALSGRFADYATLIDPFGRHFWIARHEFGENHMIAVARDKQENIIHFDTEAQAKEDYQLFKEKYKGKI